MDLVQIGNFLRKLRKERCITQEQLGKELGVTGKTVSRWETGNYLPSADMLQALSDYYNITINEILSGKRLNEYEYMESAERNLRDAVTSSFSTKERINFFKKKWLKEHIASMIALGILLIIFFIIAVLSKNPILIACWSLLLVAVHCIRNNRMMAYVERKVYIENNRK